MLNNSAQFRNSVSGRRRRRRFSPRGGFVFIFLLLIFVASVFWRGSLGGMLWQAVRPLTAVRDATTRFVSAEFSSKQQLASQNLELRFEVASLQAHVADRNSLFQQNEQLKQQFGSKNAPAGTVLAGVIAAPPRAAYDTLIIDAGAKAGIAVGNLVSAGGGAIIGKVDEVQSGTSRVALFSSPGVTIQGLLRGNIPVTVEGGGAGSISARVPSGTEASVGDAVVLPGSFGGVSEIVSAIDAPAGDSFKTLYFALPANIFGLQFVQVLTTP